MTQFDLSVWLQDKSRKVVTRSGHNVRILCTDQRGNMPIVAVVEFETLDGVQIFYSDGKNESHREYDLFFADEEEKLNDFESKLYSTFSDIWQDYMLGNEIDVTKTVKEYSPELLDLARKEILKDFPMWKKCDDNLPYSHIGGLNERYLIKNGYCIKISDLEVLPKEE